MIEMTLPAYYEHVTFLVTAMMAGKTGEPVDPQEVIKHVDALFETYEFYCRSGVEYDYVINTSGVVPEEPGNIRDRMWKWIERTSKKLGQDIDVQGTSGEYIYMEGSDWTVSESDFSTNEDGNAFIDDDLAEKMRTLLQFRAEWLKFEAKLNKKRKGRRMKT